MKRLFVLTVLILFSGIAFSQTLQKGHILGSSILTITLEPNITMEEYMDFFVNTFAPNYEKCFPGLKMRILEGVRGEQENSFVLLTFCDSIETWNKYYPDGGSSVIAGHANEYLASTWEKLLALGNWTGGFTLWEVQ